MSEECSRQTNNPHESSSQYKEKNLCQAAARIKTNHEINTRTQNKRGTQITGTRRKRIRQGM